MSSRKTVVAVRLVRHHDETTAAGEDDNDDDDGAASILDENCLRVIPPQSSKNQNQDNGIEARDYNFDYVYSSDELGDEDEPEHLMQKIGSVPVQRCLGGESSLVFGYGANGTGISHALIGSLENPGLLPRMFQRVFEALAEVPEHYTASGPAHAEVSCYHVLSDAVYDLLVPASQKAGKSPGRTAGGRSSGDGGADGSAGGAGRLESFGDPGERCRVRESPRHGAFVENVTTVVVRSNWRRAFDLLREGQSRRTRASSSNRCLSHLVFMFNVQCSGLPLGGTSTGQIQFVSFAPIATTISSRGGDSPSKVASAAAATADKPLLPSPALKSAIRCIGSSLSTLHRVVASLAKKQKHVPYRDSMLTRLLKRSLSGRAHTTLLATVSPTKDMVAETLSTLRFASNISQLTVATNIRLMPASAVQSVLLEKIKGIEQDLVNSDAGKAVDAGIEDGTVENSSAAKSPQQMLIDEAAENDRKLREEMERLRREVDLLAGLLDIDALLSIEIEYRSESNRRRGDMIVSSYLPTSDDMATRSSTVISTAESLEADSISTSHDEDSGEQEARASQIATQIELLDQAPTFIPPIDGMANEASSQGIVEPATSQRSNTSKPELELQRLRSYSAPDTGLNDALPLISSRQLPAERPDMQATVFTPQESRASTAGGTSSSPARRPGLPSKAPKRVQSESSPSRHGRMESAGRRVIRNNQRARRDAADQMNASSNRGGGRESGPKSRGMGGATTTTAPVPRTGVRPGRRAPTLPPAKDGSRAVEASSKVESANPSSSAPSNDSLNAAARVFRELMMERRNRKSPSKTKLLPESEAREDNEEQEEQEKGRNGWLPSPAQEDPKVSPSLFPSPSGLASTKDAALVPSSNADVLASNHELASIKSGAMHGDPNSLRADSGVVADDFDLSMSGASRQWKADMKMALQWAERNDARKEQNDAKATKIEREIGDESAVQRPIEEGQRTPELLVPLSAPALPLEINQKVVFESSTSVEWVSTPRPDDPEDIDVIVSNEPSRPFRSTAAVLFDREDNASDDALTAPIPSGDGDHRVDPTWYDRKPPDANARESMFLRAVMRGRNQEAIDLYAAGGLKLCAVNSFGRDAVHIAARNGNTAFLVWLGENFADFHLVSMSGDTAFHVAAWNGHVDSMDYLCQTQALDCEARTVLDGDTPAHLAARRGEMKALKWLNRMGADLWAKNHYDMTPWHQTPRCFENVRAYLQAQKRPGSERPQQGMGSGTGRGWMDDALACAHDGDVGDDGSSSF